MLEQARRSTHDTARHVTTRVTRRPCRVVTCHDVTPQVEFGLKCVYCDERATDDRYGAPSLKRGCCTKKAAITTEQPKMSKGRKIATGESNSEIAESGAACHFHR